MKFFKQISALSTKHIVMLLFILSLASGYFWNHRFYFKPVPDGDERQYSCIAENIVKEHIYTNCGHIISREPGYPFFVATIFAFSGFNPDAVRFAQLIMFAFIAILIFLLADKLFNRRIALFAALFFSLWWGLANYTGRFTREILLAFLILLLVFSLSKATEKMKNRYFVYSGALLGLLSLTHGLMKYLIVFIVVNFFFVLRKRISIRQIFIKIGLVILFFLLIISPWTIRNQINKSAGVPLTGFMLTYKAHLSEVLYPNIYKYYFGHLFGYYFAERIFPNLDILLFKESNAVQTKQKLLDKGLSEGEADKVMAKQAIKQIVSAPQKYMAVSLLHFLDLNSPLIPQRLFRGNTYAHFTFAQGRQPGVPTYLKIIILLTFRLWWLFFLFLAYYAMFKNIKNWQKLGWLLLFVIYFNAAYSAIYAIPRYITPVMSFYIIFAGVGFFAIYDKIKVKLNKRYGTEN